MKFILDDEMRQKILKQITARFKQLNWFKHLKLHGIDEDLQECKEIVKALCPPVGVDFIIIDGIIDDAGLKTQKTTEKINKRRLLR